MWGESTGEGRGGGKSGEHRRWEQGWRGQGRGQEEPGAGLGPLGAWFPKVGEPDLSAARCPPADLLASSPCRKRPLGPGEPARVPACGAGARPRPAEPGGGCVGQLWAPGHRSGCHQLADSGTGPASRLVAPGGRLQASPPLTPLTPCRALPWAPRGVSGSSGFPGPHGGRDPRGAAPCLPRHAPSGLPRGKGPHPAGQWAHSSIVSAAPREAGAGVPVPPGSTVCEEPHPGCALEA